MAFNYCCTVLNHSGELIYECIRDCHRRDESRQIGLRNRYGLNQIYTFTYEKMNSGEKRVN